MEFTIGLADNGMINGKTQDGALCPMLSMAKTKYQFDLVFPEGQFVEYVSQSSGLGWDQQRMC